MKTHDFYYDLPEELIAQTPLQQRDASRLMVLSRSTGEITHKHFYDIIDYLNPGDCLVLNDSRVLPARLLGHRPTGGAVEVLLLRAADVTLKVISPVERLSTISREASRCCRGVWAMSSSGKS